MSTDHHHDRRIEYYRVERNRSFNRGFAIGFVSCAIMVAAFLYGQREAYGSERPAPRHGIVMRGKPESMRHMAHRLGWDKTSPHWRTWLRIGVCEQARPGSDLYFIRTDRDRFNAIYWENPGSAFPGGLGFRPYTWLEFRPPSARHLDRMNLASPTQQLHAAERLYRWAERTYPGAGQTAWECHDRIAMGEKFGWYGFNEDGSWR